MKHKDEAVLLYNMCMIVNDEGKVLVINRKKKVYPGITFPGGHIEPNESFVESVIREVYEETGLSIQHPKLAGVKQFPTEKGQRFVVFMYTATQYQGTLKSSEEGEVFWLSEKEFDEYPQTEDFKDMFNFYTNFDVSEFIYEVEEDGSWKKRFL